MWIGFTTIFFFIIFTLKVLFIFLLLLSCQKTVNTLIFDSDGFNSISKGDSNDHGDG